MDIKKLLEFNLNMSRPINRLIRRAVMIGGLTAVAIFLTGFGEMNPAFLPIITGLLALIDKGLRMFKEEQNEIQDSIDNNDIEINRR